jgi:peptide/nickel transport system substrate-binding protein/oligopeptide transport system substrate-binding protein
MKKAFVSLLAGLMLVGCGTSTSAGTPAPAAEGTATTTTEAAASKGTDASTLYPTPEGVTYKAASYNAAAPDWSEYDALINEIKTTTDVENRVKLMHQAEDILMGTGAVIPLYYYNDTYMQKTDVDGIYSNLFGFKYFMFANSPRNVLKINLASEPAKVDPALNSSVDGACLDVNLFAGLYTYDSEGNLQPDLADHEKPYDLSEDGMTYTFHLIDSVWSDGKAVTANDFVYAWNRVANPETGADYQYMFDAIARKDDGTLNVTAEDDKTLTVVLGSPCAYFLDLAAFPAYLPVRQDAVEAADPEGTNPGAWASEAGFITNGAYTVSAWTHEESMVLTKNPNYYRADEVKIDEIHFMLSADDTAIYAAFQAGDLDMADSVPNNEIQNAMKLPEFHVVDNLGTYYAAWNVNSPIFEGKTVEQANAMRRAFSLLIDRQYICDTVGQTGQKPATSFIPAGMADGNGGVFKDAAKWSYTNGSDGYYPVEVADTNIAEAIALLEFAGYEFKDGKLSDATPISVTYLTNDGTGHVAAAESMQSDFAQIGINMTIETQEWAVFLDERKQGHFDFAREGWLADFNDPINMLEMWSSNSGNNDCQFGKH